MNNWMSQAVDLFNKHAHDYEQKYMDVSPYGASLDVFCQELKNEKAAVLDAGCGPGNISKYILSNHSGFQITGIDLSENMLSLARKNNPNANFINLDVRNINTLHQKFNGIVFGFCFPYILPTDVNTLLADANNLLEPNGFIYISTMESPTTEKRNLKNSHGDEMELYFYSKSEMISLLQKNHFTLKHSFRVVVETNVFNDEDMILIAEKNK